MARTKRKQTANAVVTPKKPEKNYRTAVYVRLSGEDERKVESESVENQLALLTEFVEKNDSLILAGSYIDRGISGTKFDRPDFNRMIADIRAGKIDCVVVKDLSRLGRNYLEAGDYLEKVFPFFGVRFISVTDHYDSLSSDVMEDGLLVPLKNLINESYAKDISRKISAANENRFKQGIYSARHVAYGYKRDPKDASMILPDEDTKETVQRIFAEFTSGKSLCAIARGLNAEGIPSPNVYRQTKQKTGKRDATNLWTGCTLKVILKNPVHIGDLHIGKVHQCYYKGVAKPVSREGFYIENHHEAIVDRETYKKAQEILDDSRRRRTANLGKNNHEELKKPNLLRGYFYCGDCGRKMHLNHIFKTHRNGEVVAFGRYRCYRSASYGDADKDKSIPREKVEGIIFDLIKEHIRLYMDVRDRVQVLNRKPDAKGKRAATEKRIREADTRTDEIRSMIKNLYEDFSDRVLSEDEYLEMKASYVEEMGALEAELSELKHQLEILSPDYAGNNDVEAACVKYVGAKELSRDMVEAFIKKIICYSDDRFEVEYKYSDEIQDLVRICTERGGEVS